MAERLIIDAHMHLYQTADPFLMRGVGTSVRSIISNPSLLAVEMCQSVTGCTSPLRM